MFLGISYLEWLGYISSVIVAVSLVMSSILKLRWLNLLGAALMSAYGFLIHALPVGILNLLISLVDIYYLVKIYSEKDYFKVLEIKKDDRYLAYFLDFYKDDIKRFFPYFKFEPDENTVSFYMLRNMITAGVFIAKKEAEGTLFIQMDYAVPEYRDFKAAHYIFAKHEKYFLTIGYKRFYTYSSDEKHDYYLRRIGFKKLEGEAGKNEGPGPRKTIYVKEIYPESLM